MGRGPRSPDAAQRNGGSLGPPKPGLLACEIRCYPTARAFPGPDGVRIKADSPPNVQVRNPPGPDEEVETVAMDAEPQGKLTRVP